MNLLSREPRSLNPGEAGGSRPGGVRSSARFVAVSIRWYSVVMDCKDIAAQSRWWAEALDWRKVYESEDEVILVPPHALDSTREIPPFDRGPGLVFVSVPEGKTVKNRLHIDLAPPVDGTRPPKSDASRRSAPGGSTSARTPARSAGWSWPIPRATSSACSPRTSDPDE